jgi:hypothetical protein
MFTRWKFPALVHQKTGRDKRGASTINSTTDVRAVILRASFIGPKNLSLFGEIVRPTLLFHGQFQNGTDFAVDAI